MLTTVRGGGNFGNLTTFEFRLHEVGPELMVCNPLYAAEHAREIMHEWPAFMGTAPHEFPTEFFLLTIPEFPHIPEETHGRDAIGSCGVYNGPVAEGEKFVQLLREIASVLLGLNGPMILSISSQCSISTCLTAK